MALDKLVDSTQLDSDLTSVANAIRTKGGTSAQLAFPAGFVSAIGDISSGGTPLYNQDGVAYYPKMNISVSVNPDRIPPYNYCNDLEEVTVDSTVVSNTNSENRFRDNPKLKKAIIKPWQRYNHRYLQNCPLLEEAQLGRVGVPVSLVSGYAFSNDTQNNLTITIYVADDATLPLADSPFGATNATIIYRSATSGEVITV